MGYYSDPTASQALGNINREFKKQEKKAKRLLKLYESGKLSGDAYEKKNEQFTGIFRRIPYNVVVSEVEQQKAVESGE